MHRFRYVLHKCLLGGYCELLASKACKWVRSEEGMDLQSALPSQFTDSRMFRSYDCAVGRRQSHHEMDQVSHSYVSLQRHCRTIEPDLIVTNKAHLPPI